MRVAALLLAFALCTAVPVWAQNNMGTILGSVADSSGAGIPGAVVTVVNQEGVTRTATSNGEGAYIIPELPIGIYTVTVSAPNFGVYTNDRVGVDADRNARVDARLALGTVTQQVSVTDVPPQIDTHTDTVSTVIPDELLQDMPDSGRSPIAFASLLPGVSNVSAPPAFAADRSGPTFSVSGSRVSSNLLLLDGIMHNNLFRNTGENYPPPDFLSQVEALLDNYGAQYGHNTGAVFNVLTKSGTNRLHGSLWEYNQSTGYNASNYYTKIRNPVHLNQFGATLGGPIVKNHLYYFLGYEGYRSSKNSTSASALPPTAAERGSAGAPADFTADAIAAGKNPNAFLLNPAYTAGKNYSILAPLLPAGCAAALGSGQYIANSMIPSVCLNKVIQNINNKYIPLPNGPGGTALSSYTTPLKNDTAEARTDFHFGKHVMDARYIILNTSTSGFTTSTFALPNYETLTQHSRTTTISVSDTYVVTPSIVNIARVGYNRFFGTSTPTDKTSLNSLGSNFPVLALPVLPAINVNGRLILSSNSTDQQTNVDGSIDGLEGVSITKGNHNLQVGGEYLRLQYLNRSFFYTMGQFTFNGTYTGNSMSDYMMGIVSAATAESPNIEQSGIQNNVDFYAQDDWKINKRLTLNLGLRYDLPYPWYQPQNYWATFRPGQQSTRFPAAPAGLVFPGDAGVPRGEVPTRYGDIAPRLGFALDVFGDGRTSLRGGFGIFYDQISSNIVQNNTQPFVYQQSPTITPVSISDPYASGPSFPLTQSLTNPTFTTPFSLIYPDANLKNPYVEAFNLGIQRQLTKNLSMEVNYVGKLGRHALVNYNSNPALYAPGAASTTQSYQARRVYSNFGNLATIASIGTSNYNALQVQIVKRMSRYVSAQGSYSYGKSMDVFSSEVTDTAAVANLFGTSTVPTFPGASNGPYPLAFNLRSEYGPSAFDATHIASMGYTVYLPKLAKSNILLRELLGGWNLSGIYSVRTGQALNVTFGSADYALTNTPQQRPNLLHDFRLNGGRHRADKLALTGGHFFDPTAFTASVPGGTYGNLGRNALRGPGNISNNMSAAKTFAIPGREGLTFQFRCDAFGVFNTPNLGTPNTTASGTAGQPVSATSSLGQITSTSGERSLQLSGHVRF